MRVSEQVIRALGAVEDPQIEEAGRKLSYLPKKKVRPRLRVGRTLLIAAIFAMLFSVTAYAAGWFGLSARLTEAEDTTPYAEEGDGLRHYLSFNDYAETPAAKAHAAWNVFWWDHVDGRSFDPVEEAAWLARIGEEQAAIANIYGCGDQTMLNKLLEIRDQYGVRLHTEMLFLQNNKEFYVVTGLTPFVSGEGELQMQYVYEDGSFKGEGWTKLDGEACWYTLVRGAKGALDPASNTEDRAEEYEEWVCATAKGAEVTVALGPKPEADTAPYRGCYLFYDSPDYVITVMGAVPNTEEAKSSAEKLAGCFDFAALKVGGTDLSPITQAQPREVKAKEGLLTLQDWVATDEYRASSAFQRRFCAYADTLPENQDNVRGASFYYYFGSFPSGLDEVNAAYAQIEEDYDLTMPRELRMIWFGTEVDPNCVTSHGGYQADSDTKFGGGQSRSVEERYALLGVEPFLAEGKLSTASKYDNGAFYSYISFGHSSYSLHYIPKGAFYPLFRFVLHPELEGWAYDAACGQQVYLVLGGEMAYPDTGFGYILYETDSAYLIVEADSDASRLQSIADDIDFTQFP